VYATTIVFESAHAGYRSGGRLDFCASRNDNNALFCDGHVQLIKNSVSAGPWQAIATRNGGEVVSADGF
jgi:prepilin-type processing-associated H-X9-DG protein